MCFFITTAFQTKSKTASLTFSKTFSNYICSLAFRFLFFIYIYRHVLEVEGGERHAVTAIDWSPHDRYRFVSGDERGNTFVWDVRDACSPIKVLGGERYTHLHSRSGNVRLKNCIFSSF